MINRLFLLVLIPMGLSAQINNFQWPLADVHEQQRISATFDECRDDRDHFHNGTDMPLAPGGEVLSIMAGQVTGIGSDWIRVEDFAYVHVNHNPALSVGSTVSQGAVVGWTDTYAHIHLNYGGGASGHPTGNPLLPGKIVPFNDPYHPRSPIIQFVLDGTTTTFPGSNISGKVDIIAQAADTTDLLSSIDMNNGIYTIGWALYSADTNEVLSGPHFNFEADALYSNSYIKNVYAPGSGTSIYKYIVTNRISTNGYLDCDLYEPGPYVVSVMSSDTRDNWDTTYVPVEISDVDLLPPGQPILNYVGPDENGDLHFEWTAPDDPDLAGYILEYSLDGQSWNVYKGPSDLTAGTSNYTVTGYSESAYKEFRISALDNAATPNQSEYSDTYAVQLRKLSAKYLVVDGFDRTSGSWSKKQHNFATYYVKALIGAGVDNSIITVNNEWLMTRDRLWDYGVICWFVGDDSRTDETFNSVEQAAIRDYMDTGGRLFASGAEIGYDLSAGSTDDKDFMTQVLNIDYAGDNAANLHVDGIGFDFSGIGFNYGSSPYVEDWPDYYLPANDGEAVLKYGNDLNAGIGHKTSFVSGSVVLGFSFETIDTDESRSLLMKKILYYFDIPSSAKDEQTNVTFDISGIYPNPFNASVNINYTLDQGGDVALIIYDIRGRQVMTHRVLNQYPGQHEWQWDGVDQAGKSLSSGTYLISLIQADHQSATRKLLLLK